jgi:hypothetical protein
MLLPHRFMNGHNNLVTGSGERGETARMTPMPKKTRTTGRFTPNRAKALTTKLEVLSATCHLDAVVREFRESGIFSSLDTAFCPKELGLTKQVRKVVSRTCELVVRIANFSLVYRPKYDPLIKRLFDDLELMVSLIERNNHLAAYDIVRLTERIPSRVNGVTVDCSNFSDDPEKTTLQLMSHLDTSRSQLKEYLRTYRQARGRRRNHDPLSREFIMNMFYTWQMFRYGDDDPVKGLDPLRPEDRPLFARFLAAAWRDAGFPLTDHRGKSREPLENWFADRIRKRFSDRGFPTGDFELDSEAPQQSNVIALAGR